MVFPQTWISYVSLFSIILLIWMMISGFKDGLLLKLCDLLSTITSIIMAIICVRQYGDTIQIIPKDFWILEENFVVKNIVSIYANRILLFLGIFLLIRFIFALIRPLFKKFNKIPILGFINKSLGILIGLIQGYIILVLIAMVFSGPIFVNGNQVLKESNLYIVQDHANTVVSFMNDQYKELKDLSEKEEYKEDDYGTIRIWFDYYELDQNTQEQILSIIKNRSE